MNGPSERRGARLAARLRARAAWVRAALVGSLVLVLAVATATPAQLLGGELVPGRPSPRDVVAPRSARFVSEHLTERARAEADAAVAATMGTKDPGVGSRQVQRARDVLRLVGLYRREPYATLAEAQADLSAVPELGPRGAALAERLLGLDDAAWTAVRDEAPKVVALVLRSPVRESGLAAARAGAIASVDRNLDAEVAELAARIAGDFVVPNLVVDPAATADARRQAREAVADVVREVAAGEMVVRQGEIVTEEAYEALAALGIAEPDLAPRDLAAALLLALAQVAVATLLLTSVRAPAVRSLRHLALVVGVVAAFAVAARFVVGRTVLAYAFPSAAAAMMLMPVSGLPTAVAASLVLGITMGAMGGMQLEPLIFVLLGSLAGAVTLGRIERLVAFPRAGAALLAADLAVLAAVVLGAPSPDARGVLELAGAALANALLSTGLAALGILVCGAWLGVTTSLQLLELARPDHPLLRELQLRAPGTYHHSVVVGNLAERAASAIGADVVLARVAAYYHDVGKLVRPYFFVENQLGGLSPHDGLAPEESARVVLSHVDEGIALARRHRLPEAVVDAIRQHHGTTRVEYFLRAAQEADGTGAVDVARFTYPGPPPTSRETAILMLADGSEASVRAAAPKSREEIEAIVARLIRTRLADGQLDRSALTLADLGTIQQAFVTTLQSMYHPRIRYPERAAPPGEAAAPGGGLA